MRVPRAYIDQSLAVGERVALPDDTVHHCLRVLRLRDGAELRLFNGEPGDWLARLVVRGKRRADAEVRAFEPRDAEPPLALTLVQGISRGQRMDYTLEKSVELGVSRIAPVVMARSHGAPEGERIERKARHWAGVVAAAAAQSGRTRLPALEPQADFRAWLAAAHPADHPHVLLDPDAAHGPRGVAAECRRLTLLAGPEGGFAPQERQAALEAGCVGMRLGPRILRTETAAVAAIAALQALHGDLG
jgi:16S rRNA (uracil1498-N3)-methyltransferase